MNRIVLDVCDLCLSAKSRLCETEGCAFWHVVKPNIEFPSAVSLPACAASPAPSSPSVAVEVHADSDAPTDPAVGMAKKVLRLVATAREAYEALAEVSGEVHDAADTDDAWGRVDSAVGPLATALASFDEVKR